MTTNLDGIPVELRALRQWVCYRLVPSKSKLGKIDKMPYQIDGQLAKSDDPATWYTYEQVVKVISRFDGIGIMFADGLTGVDLDHSVGGGGLSDFARGVVSRLDSYTELSPSDHGLHILTWGTLPDGRRRDDSKGIEMYAAGRFFTVTGNRIEGTPATIEHRDQELAELHREVFGEPEPVTPKATPQPVNLADQDLLDKAMAAENGDKFYQLWIGDCSGHSDNHSEADLALCSHLAFWCGGDPVRMDSLFRQSGLVRPKWDERHDGDGRTYGQMTVEKALQNVTEFYSPNGDGPDSPNVKVELDGSSSCPALPESARLPADLGLGASPWLDSYVSFSRHWSPRGYDGFHEACGLWVLSTLAARRVVLHFGKPFYTPLYIALTARTSLYAKSTTADIAVDVLRTAGLDHLLCADDSTPQRFIQDLTTHVPEDFDELPESKRDWIKKRLATAGQRGWFYEEFGQHLEGITRPGGYMGEFRGLLRRFDDCKLRYEYATIGRGSNVVQRPYLALLASMTPADMRPIAKRNAAMWNDGFFARFVFVTPPTDERKRDRFPVGERIVPRELTAPLVAWHNRLGLPGVTITNICDGETNEPTGKKSVEIEYREPVTCRLGAGVVGAFYTYHDALLSLVAESDNQDLDGNYARFAEKAMRVSILLASLENGNVIELHHWARGQEIAEHWRANLHALFEQVGQPGPTEDAQNEEKVLNWVRRLGWVSPREVAQRIRGLSTAQVHDILKTLVDENVLTERPALRTVRYGFPTDPQP